MLNDRREPGACWRRVYPGGMGGKGGSTSCEADLKPDGGRRGDCSRRNVRLVIELELETRRRVWGGGEVAPRGRSGCDTMDERRCNMRLVWTFSTG